LSSAHKAQLAATQELSSVKQQTQLAMTEIHAVAEALDKDLAETQQLNEEYRETVEECLVKEHDRRDRHQVQKDLQASEMHKAQLQQELHERQRAVAESQENLQSMLAVVKKQQKQVVEMKAQEQAVCWYQSLQGMLTALGGIRIAPNGVQETCITFQVANIHADAVPDATVAVHFAQKQHKTVREIEVLGEDVVPFNDLAVSAVRMNNWQMFLQEYQFRCMNVGECKAEVDSVAAQCGLTWVGVKEAELIGFAHYFEAPCAASSHSPLKLLADLEYPQQHSVVWWRRDDGSSVVLNCTDEEIEQHEGSRLLASLQKIQGQLN